MNILDPISIPLNQASLIEASAGTGKTYTMVNLYLRLVLGVGCEPLLVEQILVVTFTKAATQELRDRIRAKLAETAHLFASPEWDNREDPFLTQLYESVKENLGEALLRLRLAERDMDLASIFTIDSFCQKMLFQYAFDSGVRFDLDLQPDESELLKRLSQESWRELFYPADLAESKLVAQFLHHPQSALEKVKSYLSERLPSISEAQKAWLMQDYRPRIAEFEKFLVDTRTYWKTHYIETIAPLEHAFAKQYNEKAKILNGVSYKESSFREKWLPEINTWAECTDWHFPEKTLRYFSQSMLEAKASKGAKVLRSIHFEKWDTFLEQYQAFHSLSAQIETKLLYRYFTHLRQKLADYKSSHIEKNFNDMLNEFHHSLYGENGTSLATKIRLQFGFAMIDESQDTNQIQYQIFKRIFLEGEAHGFILIGDPKQSIYKFRGADIFSYLEASTQVAQKFTLAKNWRSLPEVVRTVNQFFTLPPDKPPFLYEGIRFSPVDFKQSDERLLDSQQTLNLYFQASYHTEEAAQHCAEQICQQLTEAQNGRLWLQTQEGERSLEPKDIAILVRSHNEAAAIKGALSQRNLQAVFLSEKKSVFSSQEAHDLRWILNACLTPFSQKAVLAALGTALWGLNSAEIYQLKNNENDWENCVEQFIYYQQLWQTQGVLPMLHRLFIREGIVARINGGENADRRLTNLLHLAELLQEKMDTAENEAMLVRWLTHHIDNPRESEEQVLRLESEADLIKIITIHKSKGLEYPVVWLPFVAKSSKPIPSAPMLTYRDAQHQLQWDFNSGDDTVKQLREQEERAEDLRLLYVALTRAKYQLHLILPEKWGSGWNALHYLLSNGQVKKDASSREALETKAIAYQGVTLSEEIATTRFKPNAHEATKQEVKIFTGNIRETGLITSFTALQAQHERLQHSARISPLATFGDEAQDYDRTSVQDFSVEPPELNGFSPYQFPHSTKVGNLLHRYFEQLDFSQPITEESVQPLCEQLGLAPDWIAPMQHWFQQILHTPLRAQGFSLAQIEPHKRLNEWQFYLRLSNRHALPKLNSLLKQHSPLAKNLPDLQLRQLDGFVRGFIDCIVEVEHRFYILDYKSNFLGYLAQDYFAENIEKAMGKFRYDLQYLLYTLALHRYLRSRLGEHYDYERDFGGVAYLFLRAMDGTAQSGVFFDKPSTMLIDELDQLFG